MRGRTVGDFLEWVAAVLAIVGGLCWLGPALALFIAAGCLAYFAQVEDSTPIKRLQLKLKLRHHGVAVPKQKAGVPQFHCARCGYEGPSDIQHTCPAI